MIELIFFLAGVILGSWAGQSWADKYWADECSRLTQKLSEVSKTAYRLRVKQDQTEGDKIFGSYGRELVMDDPLP